VLFDVSVRVALIRNTNSMASQQLLLTSLLISHRPTKSKIIKQVEKKKLENTKFAAKKITAASRPFVAAQSFHALPRVHIKDIIVYI
jgi:hypothetical protein